ncbi:exodeoxyribonuclease VII large subunit [Canibacter zhoujuaniae]|uniref:exodeoxyribonuclease VII large subunit n=1 Tax=Canibacter zhoujuaniae TaxID=2708343 RepID=UPI001FBA3A58|nr:exodeoxyribonuclease VII large subunit [Canibacter zhoujuaniae]
MPQAPSESNPLSVARVSEVLKRTIKGLGAVWVEGEITEWKENRGNVYGRLRDLDGGDDSLSFNIWSSVRAQLQQDFHTGDHVVLLAEPDYWTARGSLSFNVKRIKTAGLGELMQQLEKLRQKLAAEGLFAEDRKLPLPFLPGCIGLITGRDSDAEKDVLKNTLERWPGIPFEIVHTAVQGVNAASQVTQAIQQLDADPRVDVIIIARGGGDFLDLLPFSDETLVRTAAAAKTPIISAIGHEADRPLLDEVADYRASTPTGAAKRVVPSYIEEHEIVTGAVGRIRARLTHTVEQEYAALSNTRSRPVLQRPESMFEQQEIDVQRLAVRSAELIDRQLYNAASELNSQLSQLRALSPLATLKRGYAMVLNSEAKPISKTSEVQPGDTLKLRVSDGEITAIAE